MRYTLREIATVTAGVLLFDYFFCGKIAPKMLAQLNLTPLPVSDCRCGGGCDSCSKNITDKAQVIDVTPLSAEKPS